MCFYSESENIMQKIQSKSQTGRLYQHPTPENTIKNKKSGLLIPALIVIAMCLAGVVNCAGYQNAVAKMGIKQ